MQKEGTVKKVFLTAMATGLLTLAWSGAAMALDYDFSGAFLKDNDVLRFNFTVDQASEVTVFSSSWVNGGFDPILAIWTADGDKMHQQDDGYNTGSTLSNGVSYDHGLWDSYFTVNLEAGQYIATVAQYDNFAQSDQLSDGFRYDAPGDSNFRNGFVDTHGAQCTGDWAFHLLNVHDAEVIDPNEPPAAVPEPGALFLLGAGLLGLTGVVRSRKEQ